MKNWLPGPLEDLLYGHGPLFIDDGASGELGSEVPVRAPVGCWPIHQRIRRIEPDCESSGRTSAPR
jgi:hypothetical protein